MPLGVLGAVSIAVLLTVSVAVLVVVPVAVPVAAPVAVVVLVVVAVLVSIVELGLRRSSSLDTARGEVCKLLATVETEGLSLETFLGLSKATHHASIGLLPLLSWPLVVLWGAIFSCPTVGSK